MKSKKKKKNKISNTNKILIGIVGIFLLGWLIYISTNQSFVYSNTLTLENPTSQSVKIHSAFNINSYFDEADGRGGLNPDGDMQYFYKDSYDSSPFPSLPDWRSKYPNEDSDEKVYLGSITLPYKLKNGEITFNVDKVNTVTTYEKDSENSWGGTYLYIKKGDEYIDIAMLDASSHFPDGYDQMTPKSINECFGMDSLDFYMKKNTYFSSSDYFVNGYSTTITLGDINIKLNPLDCEADIDCEALEFCNLTSYTCYTVDCKNDTNCELNETCNLENNVCELIDDGGYDGGDDSGSSSGTTTTSYTIAEPEIINIAQPVIVEELNWYQSVWDWVKSLFFWNK